MSKGYTHDATIDVFNAKGKCVGNIDVRLHYRVTSWGRPARINYNENDHPAEGPEVDLYHAEMLNEPKAGRQAIWIDAFDWLYDMCIDYADENVSEMVGSAGEYLQGIADANDDAKSRYMKDNR